MHRLAALALLILAGCDSGGESDAVFEVTSTFDTSAFNEPSGIVYHPGRQVLFVVGDDGDVAELTTAGETLRVRRVQDAEFEGLTVNPTTGLLYAVIEGGELIVEIEPEGLRPTRVFTISRTDGDTVVLPEGGQGVEGITFVGGETFAVVNQGKDGDPNDPPTFVELRVPLAGTTLNAEITSHRRLDFPDLSGLHYDASRQRYYVLSDDENLFVELDRASNELSRERFIGNSQEGITIGPDGTLYVAQDAGAVLEVRWNR